MSNALCSSLVAVAASAAIMVGPARARAQADSASRWTEREAIAYESRALPTAPRPRWCRERGELDLFGVHEISVAPSGAVWLTRESGETFHSQGVDQPFSESALDCRAASSRTPRGRCDRIDFFTDDVAIATGYVGDRHATIFWTGDGGHSWEARPFTNAAYGGWIYEAFTTPRGEVWMGGSSGILHHSTDFGRTWSEVTTPFDGAGGAMSSSPSTARIHSIFMVDSQRGVVGALDDGIRVTTDAGRSWRAIPTPLDQGVAQPRTTTDRRVRVAWIGDALLAQQGERVFRSGLDPVRWQPVGSFVAFTAERDGSHVFALDAQGRVSELDTSLSPRRVAGARLPHPAIDLRAEAGALFVLDQSNGLHRFGGAGNVSAAASRAGAPETIESVRRAGSLLLGISPHMVHLSADGGSSWCAAAVSAGRLRGLTVRSNTEAILWGAAGVQRFGTRTGRLRPIRSFGAAEVVAMHVTPRAWLAATVTPRGASALWRSTNAGRAWTEVDARPSGMVATFIPIARASVLAWSYGQGLARVALAGSNPVAHLGSLSEVAMLCCRSGYFATEREGFVRGYVHHLGDHVYATSDGGRTWTQRPGEDFPYERVVPAAGGSLAVAGGSFDYRASAHRDLWLLSNAERRRVFRAPAAISDVSVDPRGRILLELDETPSATFETVGRRWIELTPP